MRLTEGIRFKKRNDPLTTLSSDSEEQPDQTEPTSTGAPGEVWQAAIKRGDIQNRIRSLKNMCQM